MPTIKNISFLVILASLSAVQGFTSPALTTRSMGIVTSMNNPRLPPSHHNSPLVTPLNFLQKSGLQMSVEGDFDPEALSKSVEEAKAGSIKAKLRALYKFTRPHTIRGTILASIAGTTRALIDTPGALANANWGFMLPRAVIGMIALLMGNAFIVGINQIYDKDIDMMNKPFLPVASGEMSNRFAWATVLTGGIVGPLLV